MMASHQLAIAKASFTASLLRPDPVSILRDEISHFHDLVNLVATHCSPKNVQNCKRWILRNVVQSAPRFAAFGKYLTALSTSFEDLSRPLTSNKSQREPSAKRKRLHLLYLVNDILHHAEFYDKDAPISGKVQHFLVGLLSITACFANSPKHYRKIEGLLDIWEDRNYYSKDYIEKLREAVKISRDAEQSLESTQPLSQTGQTQNHSRPYRNMPFVMPAIHGDQGTPWYDLPAGNLMPHIIPNTTRPINPVLVRPLRFVAGPVHEDLASAVKNILQEVNSIFGIADSQDQCESISWDIDELGQENSHDDVNRRALSNDSYYGWSKPFCEKVRRVQKSLESTRVGYHERPSRSQSERSSLSRHRYKRRRYSNSDEESTGARSRSRSRNRSRLRQYSYSSSRSHSEDRKILQQRDKHSKVMHKSISRSASLERSRRDVPSVTYPPELLSKNSVPNLIQEQFGHDVQTMSSSQQAFLQTPGYTFGSAVTSTAPPLHPHYGQWAPEPSLPQSTVPYTQEVHPAGSWPPPSHSFTANWPVSSYGQVSTGPHNMSESTGGVYAERERDRDGPPQQYSNRESDHSRYGGDSRGNNQ